MSEYVYEVREESDDEMYYSLGFFTNPDTALDTVMKEYDKEQSFRHYKEDGESERVVIRERKLNGFDDGHGKVMYTVVTTYLLDEEKDEYVRHTREFSFSWRNYDH